MSEAAAQAFLHARDVKDRVAQDLMQIPGVLGVGVGSTPTEEPCLVILTSIRVADAQKRLHQELARLDLDDVPVVTRQAGELRAG